jgi:hypothetical protein
MGKNGKCPVGIKGKYPSELWEEIVGIMGKNGKCPVGIKGKYPSELWEEIVGIVGPYLNDL